MLKKVSMARKSKFLIIFTFVSLTLIGGITLFHATRPLPGSGLQSAPVPVVPLAHALAIMDDGSLRGWSTASQRYLGDETITHPDEPINIMNDAAAVSSIAGTTMVISSDGTLWTYGRPIQGSRHWLLRSIWFLTPISAPFYFEPERLMENVVAVSMSSVEWNHAMAITSDEGLWAWGSNSSGQLGTGSTESSVRRPVRIMDDVIAVSAGGFRTFAITSDGSLWACAQYILSVHTKPLKI